MKTLGIIGGLGPMATAYFMELVTGMTDVDCDQKHIPIVLQSIPQTPDRTSYILDHIQKNPLPQMVEAGKRLKEAGAAYLAIPCVTAHYFYRSSGLNLLIDNLHDFLLLSFIRQQRLDMFFS